MSVSKLLNLSSLANKNLDKDVFTYLVEVAVRIK
jgi:hypothetical protein